MADQRGTRKGSIFDQRANLYAGYNGNGQPRYFYQRPDNNRKLKLVKIIVIAFVIMTILPVVIGSVMLGFFSGKQTIKPSSYDSGVMIEDTAGILGDTDELENQLEILLDKTGVSAVIITIDNSVWQDGSEICKGDEIDLITGDNYRDLTQYTADLYRRNFDDQKHWLVVLANDQLGLGYEENWNWADYRGEDTKSFLSDSAIRKFNETLKNELDKKQAPSYALYEASHDLIRYTVISKSLTKMVTKLALFFGIMIVITCVLFKLRFFRKASEHRNYKSSFNSSYGAPPMPTPPPTGPINTVTPPTPTAAPGSTYTDFRSPYSGDDSASEQSNPFQKITPNSDSDYGDDEAEGGESLIASLFKRKKDDDYE